MASIIFSLAPVLTPVFAFFFLSDEHLSARGAVGLVLGLLGVGIVIQPDPSSLLSGNATGQLILLCAAVSVALGSVLIRYVDSSLSSTVTTAWGLPFGAATLHLAGLAAGESLASIQWTPMALLTLGYVGVFAGAIAYTAYFALLNETGAIRANLINYVVPVVTVLLGWTLLGETITATTVVGFFVIFAGFALIGYRALKDLFGSIRLSSLRA